MGEHHVHVVLGEQHRDAAAAREFRRELHQLVSFLRRHAGGGLVHQQEARAVGQRDRQFDALQVAVGEHCAGTLGLLQHADPREERVGLLARSCAWRGRPSDQSRRWWESRAICTFSRTVIEAKVAVIWNVRPTPRRQMSRGLRPIRLRPSNSICPASGRDLAVEHVEAGGLARAVGADQRQQFAGRDAEAHIVHGLHAAVGLGQVRATAQHRHRADLSRRNPVDALREHEHQQQDDAAEHCAPEVDVARDRVLQPGEDRGAATAAGERLDAAQQHHHEAVHRAGDRQCFGRDDALGEGVHGAGQAGEKAGEREPHPLPARTSMPMASARSGESRPARSA